MNMDLLRERGDGPLYRCLLQWDFPWTEDPSVGFLQIHAQSEPRKYVYRFVLASCCVVMATPLPTMKPSRYDDLCRRSKKTRRKLDR